MVCNLNDQQIRRYLDGGVYSSVPPVVVPPEQVPAAISSLSVIASVTTATLSWTPNTWPVTVFRRNVTAGGSFTQIATGIAGTASNYVSSGLTADTQYEWRIITTNGVGDSPVSNTVAATTQSASSGLVASYNFNAGDNTQTAKNGFAFESNGRTVAIPSGQSEGGIPFTFTGQGSELTAESINEIHFSFPQIDEWWIRQRVFIPAHYKHRAILVVNVTGSMAGWQVGHDVVAGVDGSTAKIYGITGQQLRLEFAENPYAKEVWGNPDLDPPVPQTITNTTLSQSVSSLRQELWATNNKLLSVWCDGYSTQGKNPCMIFESHSRDGIQSNGYVHFSVDNQVAGSELGGFDDFITTADFGTWIEVVYAAKLSSALNVSDGWIQMYIKRSGESAFTRKLNVINQPLWKRTGTATGFSAGYLHGAHNSGYAVTTILTDSVFELYSSKPNFLP